MFSMLDCIYFTQFVFLASLKPLYFILHSVTKMTDKCEYVVLNIVQELKITQTLEQGNLPRAQATPVSGIIHTKESKNTLMYQ
jgi:hypothetical protein